MMDQNAMAPGVEEAPVLGAEKADVIVREPPEVDPARAANVRRWIARIKADKAHWESDFKRIRKDQDWAYYGCDPTVWSPDDLYTVNVVQRHLNQTVAALYARNPRVQVKRKPRLDFILWDERAETLQAALQSVAQAQQAGMVAQQALATGMAPDPMAMQATQPDPNAVALLEEVQEVQNRRRMVDKIGKTLEILFGHYTAEQSQNFKDQLKQLVRRTKTCGVGYIELGFQRLFEKRPEIQAKIDDVTKQIQTIERISADVADGELQGDDHADLDELKAAVEELQSQATVLAREGVIFDFPRTCEIIPDKRTRQIKGWIGTQHLTREMHLSTDEVKEVYGIDVGKAYVAYDAADNQKVRVTEDKDGGLACVWRVQDKATGTTFTLIDGYPDFVKGPESMDVKIERFFTIIALTLNDAEHDDKVFPRSDVTMLRHPQDEINRAGQGLLEHRRANKPKYLAGAGVEDADLEKIATGPAHSISKVQALQPNQKAEDLVTAVKHAPIDPAVYNTQPMLDDINRTVGASEATTFGVAGDSTATGESIAESARTLSQSSNVDDLDGFLSEVARAFSQIALMELSAETVKKIAGRGAVWPEFSREEIADEILMDVKAGSSGRPNKAQELASMERGMPYLQVLPGINPRPLAERYFDLLDLDLEDGIVEGLPSIVAMNQMAGRQAAGGMGGDPARDPQNQGGKGADNAPKGQENEPGGQPAYPAGEVLDYDASGARVQSNVIHYDEKGGRANAASRKAA